MKPLTDLETIRAQELLVQRATEGLDDAALAELERFGATDVDAFDLAAATVAVALVTPEPMPAGLADRVLAAAVRARADAAPPAPRVAASSSTAPAVPAVAAQLPDLATSRPRVTRRTSAAPRTSSGFARWGLAGAGWAAAAVFAAIALTRSPGRARAPEAPSTVPAGSGAEVTPAQASLTAAVVAGPDPAGAQVTGEVRWHPTDHRGQLRLRGLAVNDPRVARYQLWIVDGAREAGHAVDGGLFDVRTDGEAVIPFATSLPVVRPVAVEVTLEAPIGAVVSTRARLVAHAAFSSP